MAQTIEQQITSYFSSPLKTGEKRKILYLFDDERTYWDSVSSLAEETGEFKVLEVDERSYFKIQYQVEKELADEHLFLYYTIPQPSIQDNPLIDVLLYSQELRVDKESQLLLTLGIDPEEEEIRSVVEAYPVFFRSQERTQRFKRLFQQTAIRSKETAEYAIFAALTKAEAPDWMAVLRELFEEEVSGESAKWDMIVKFGDVERFWGLVDQLVGYNEETSASGSRSINELMRHVFFTHLDSELENGLPRRFQPYVLPHSNVIVVFINQWMNTRNKEESYKQAANYVQDTVDFSDVFDDAASGELSEAETFQWFDYALIQRVLEELTEDSLDYERLEQMLLQRRNKFWYAEFREVYHALKWSVRLLKNVESFAESIRGIRDAETIWKEYLSEWYRIDLNYRKFYTYFDKVESEWREALSALQKKLEYQYVRVYLTKLAEKWDALYPREPETGNAQLQAHFFKEEVQPFAEKDRRVFVLISDGMRYEAGRELFLKLTETTRYNGEFDWLKTELPSITSIGMASLLPHETIEIGKNGIVFADRQSTSGVKNRETILQAKGHPDAIAVKSEDLNQLNQSQLRELMAGKKVVYIYHDRIDAIGDNRKTEHDVLEATEKTIQQLKRLMDRLTTEVSASQFLVTADHGYLYTRDAIRETEKINMDGIEGATTKNKRFLVSKEPIDHPSGIQIPLSDRLSPEGYLFVPRGMNRFALAGGGYQYVHGGHLPQEMLVPLLRVKTDRGRNKLEEVSVTLVSQTRTITNPVVWLDFLQLDPVGEVLKEKRLNLYFEDEDGEKISNEVLLIADSENAMSAERVFKEKFIFLSEKEATRQKAYLVMENANDPEDVVKEEFRVDLI